jgi:DNA-binding response OmpR family regulator
MRQATLPRRTVLVVDDDAAVTATFARMLQLEGYEVVTALSAETALLVLADVNPDAMLLDLHMPLVGGLAFLRRLRAGQAGRDLPVAIVTGDYGLDDAMLCGLDQLGASVFFKPIWLDDLLQIMQWLMRES